MNGIARKLIQTIAKIALSSWIPSRANSHRMGEAGSIKKERRPGAAL
ncbi:MAG TPA: hypothetical protein VHC39_12115 [Rhizomicrobium sp.]|nr:hypothetical protein [Rhizomicrobium sp.]